MKKSILKILILCVVISLFVSCRQNSNSDKQNTSSNENNNSDSVSLSLINAWESKDFSFNDSALAEDFVINDISFDPETDQNIFLATSHGVFQSKNGGGTFENSAVGFLSENVDLIEIDPNNSKCIVALCVSNSKTKDSSGIYVSSNSVQGFQKTEDLFIPVNNSKLQLVFDSSSYQNGKSSIVYLVGVVKLDDDISVEENALYRSYDGGKTFSLVAKIQPDSEISVHPTKGYVYLTNSTGFYRSIDHGETFETILGASSTHIFVSQTNVNRVTVAGINGMLKSEDSGETFESTAGVVPRMSTAVIYASNLNEKNMVCYYQNHDKSYTVEFSTDHGITWKTSVINTKTKVAFSSSSYKIDFAWSLNSPSTVVMVYNNNVYKSDDYGENFYPCENSIKAFDIQSSVSENAVSPQYKALAIGRNNIALTLDNAQSWGFYNLKTISKNEYIANVYPINRTTLAVIIGKQDASNYALAFFNKDSEILTRSFADDLISSAVTGDKGNKNLIFAGNYISYDLGKNWEKMNGCDAVITQNPYSPSELFGVCGEKVVMSVDKGKSWIELFDCPFVSDMAYDYFEGVLYVVANNNLYKYTSDKQIINCTPNIPKNHFDEILIQRVEVDQNSPGRVYISGISDFYVNDSCIMLSLNCGEKWYVINSVSNNTDLPEFANAIQTFDITVDNQNGTLISYSGMYGMYEFDIDKTTLK